MAEVDGHLLAAGLLPPRPLLLIDIEELQLGLHLLQLGRTEPLATLGVLAVVLADLHQSVGALQQALQLSSHLDAELGTAL